MIEDEHAFTDAQRAFIDLRMDLGRLPHASEVYALVLMRHQLETQDFVE